jgi:diguanylate cyclase (GGDEF)-like protein/PAS domain S-box-containing protein
MPPCAVILSASLVQLLAVLVIAAQAVWIYLAYRRAKTREALFRIITENAADMIALVDTKGRRLYNSPAYQRILGYSAPELAQTSVFEQIHPDDRFKVLDAAREASASGVGKSLQYRVRHKNGSWRILESTASTIRNERGEVEKLVIVNRDVTQRVEAEEKLAHNALHDALTDLPNRRLFLDRLQRAFTQAQRDSKFHYAVLLADLDGFKKLNHTLGPAAGDQVLIEMGQRLATCLRSGDSLARPRDNSAGDVILSRLGGDEFAILLENCADPSDLLRISERIQSAVAAPLMVAQGPLNVRVSVGSALSATAPKRADDPLRDAEIALRRAQALGGGRSELFDPAMHNRAVTRLKLEGDLRTALNRNQFRVLYQPLFRMEPREVIAFEALIRWQHPEQGLISPHEFLAAAEDSGLMAMIDQWVIREACRNLQLWVAPAATGKPLRIAVNLSARHFASAELVEGIKTCLREVNIPAGALQLEIAERVAMSNPDLTATIFAQLKRLNVVIAIDDFCAATLSLAALRRFCPDILKIDRSLISSMQADRASHELVDLIFTLARKLNIQVVAEGIERPAQLHALRSMSCDYAQGYFFSPPLAADVAQRFLDQQPHSVLPSRSPAV